MGHRSEIKEGQNDSEEEEEEDLEDGDGEIEDSNNLMRNSFVNTFMRQL